MTVQGILGKKVGMTQVFQGEGRVVPVTVIQAGPCTVTQLRVPDIDGYQAAQLGFQEAKRLNKPMRGHLKGSAYLRYLREFPVEGLDDVRVGQRVTVEMFQPGDRVDVTARSKGRGFQGGMKRYGFGGGPRTHGQSDRARAPGSIGAGTTPGRVLKGKKMAGHMGNVVVTVKDMEVVRVDTERNLLLVKGGVPGAPNGMVMIRKGRKAASGAGA